MINVIARVLLSLLILAAGSKVFCSLVALQIARAVPGPFGLNEAIRWDPQGPEYFFELGVLYRDQLESQDLPAARRSFETALNLNPYDWQSWLELGRAYEVSGLSQQAETAYLKAVGLNPRSSSYHWRVANFYIRTGDLEKSYGYLQTALAINPSYRKIGLALLWNAGVAPQEIDRVWPNDTESRLLLLDFLVKNQGGDHPTADFVDQQWARLLAGEHPPAVTQGVFYPQHLVKTGRYREARIHWIRLAEKNSLLDGPYARKENFLWNGRFEMPFSKAPFDWRVPAPGRFSIARTPKEGVDGTPGLRLDFPGAENIDFRGIQQQVLVEPGQTYEFFFDARSASISTEQGLYFQILDSATGGSLLETEQVLGTTSWKRYSSSFRVGAGTNLLLVVQRRRPSRRIDNLLRGSVWFDTVILRSVPTKKDL